MLPLFVLGERLLDGFRLLTCHPNDDVFTVDRRSDENHISATHIELLGAVAAEIIAKRLWRRGTFPGPLNVQTNFSRESVDLLGRDNSRSHYELGACERFRGILNNVASLRDRARRRSGPTT